MKPNLKKFSVSTEAISPIVATLLLVLVAAGAAIGFGVFLNGFQNHAQNSVQSNAAQDHLRVAGSTTVTPMITNGLESWHAANPGIAIDLSPVGSGSGIRAVCHDNADIGMSSKPTGVEDGVSANQIIPGADAKTCPDFNNDGVQDPGQSLQLYPIAIDGIVVISNGNQCAGGLQLTQAMVRELYRVNGAGGSIVDSDGVTAGIQPGIAGFITTVAGPTYKWGDIATTGVAPTSTVDGTPGCVGAITTGANVIKVFQRADAGGTEDAFCTLIADKGFTGSSTICSAGELKAAGTVGTTAFDGNTALESAVSGDNDAISFMSYGFAKSSTLVKAANYGTTTLTKGTQFSSNANDGKVKDGARGVAGGYDASRKLWVMTSGSPSTQEQLFLDFFVNNASQNKAFANKAGYIGINE